MLSPRWRQALEHSLNADSASVFRAHYADGHPTKEVLTRLHMDRVTFDGLRGGMREVVRQAAMADGAPIDEWPNERLDRLIRRLAAFSIEPCPALPDILEGHTHLAHISRCARCDRARRLVKAQVLLPADLLVPAQGARCTEEVHVLALHLHPQGRRFRKSIHGRLKGQRAPIGDDILIVALSDSKHAYAELIGAAESGSPRRDHIRGAVVAGPGRWSRYGLLGPLCAEAEKQVKSRTWGHIDGLQSELPAPLPAPPSATRWWIGVAGLTVACGVVTALALREPPVPPNFPFEVDFTAARGGIWTAFDVDDSAHVAMVRQIRGDLNLVLSPDNSALKADFAVGDGSYRLHTVGSGVLIASSEAAIPDLEDLLSAAEASNNPLGELQDAIQRVSPGADVRTFLDD